jgi:hypothetical protein
MTRPLQSSSVELSHACASACERVRRDVDTAGIGSRSAPQVVPAARPQWSSSLRDSVVVDSRREPRCAQVGCPLRALPAGECRVSHLRDWGLGRRRSRPADEEARHGQGGCADPSGATDGGWSARPLAARVVDDHCCPGLNRQRIGRGAPDQRSSGGRGVGCRDCQDRLVAPGWVATLASALTGWRNQHHVKDRRLRLRTRALLHARERTVAALSRQTPPGWRAHFRVT